jgi:hypothetical protein
LPNTYGSSASRRVISDPGIVLIRLTTV